jgi:hypothetical protein
VYVTASQTRQKLDISRYTKAANSNIEPIFVMSSLRSAMLSLCLLLGSFSFLAQTAAEPIPGLLPKIPIVDALLALGASPPPKALRSVNPSPECAAINQGELMCCRATVAGDVQLVVWLAMVYGYDLNPNDINGLNCKEYLRSGSVSY